MLRDYYRLTKPGIISGNIMNMLAGFFLAVFIADRFHFTLFIAMLVGSTLVLASGCVYNNYLDRALDQKMARTKRRASAAGRISGRNCLIYGSLLGVFGFTILSVFTNWLTVACAAFGFVDYVFVYAYFKRASEFGTLVGAISGAMPPVIGYVAVASHLDMAAISLFLMLFFWQMPHFYAIAIYRRNEYQAAGLPVWPVKRSVESTKKQIVSFMIVFMAACLLLPLYGYVGIAYVAVIASLCILWLRLALSGFKRSEVDTWARQVFRFSLILTIAMTAMIPLGVVLP